MQKLRIYELGLIVSKEGDAPSVLIAAESLEQAVKIVEGRGQAVGRSNTAVYEISSKECAVVVQCYNTTTADLLIAAARR